MKGIYRRGAIYWITYKAGHRLVRESTGTDDRRLAEGVLSKRRAEVFEGRWKLPAPVAKTTVQLAVEEFIAMYAKPRKVSWQEDDHILKRFVDFLGGDATLHQISRKTIEEFLLTAVERGLSHARINRYIQCLKCFFNRCIDWGKLEGNPCKGIKLYKETPRVRWLEDQQIATLLKCCSQRLRPIVQTALLTGLRIGDILHLHWDMMDFTERVIRLVVGKTRTPLVLPVSPLLAEVWKGLPRHPGTTLLFQQRGREVIQEGWLRGDFKRATSAAGLAGLRMHDLRHTAATQLRRSGCDLLLLQRLLAHRSLRMTQRYAHVHPEEMRAAVDRLAEKSHFTITSQLPQKAQTALSAPIQNASIFEHESESVPSGEESIRQAVNLSSDSSEDW